MSDESIDVEYEQMVEFELTDELSLFYSRTSGEWYIENFAGDSFKIEDETVYMLEDPSEDIYMEEEQIEVFGYLFSKDMLDDYKEIATKEE